MSLNEKDFRKFIKIYDTIEDRINALLAVVSGSSLGYGAHDGFEFYSDYVEIQSDYRHCSGCGTETTYYKVPLKYLWEEDGPKAYKVHLEEERANKAKADAELKAKQEAKAAAQREAAERAKYEELRAKYQD